MGNTDRRSRPNTVSVIIPTYNRPDMAVRSATCALNQTGIEVDVIVVDDCSPDVPEGALRNELPPEVRVHRMEQNGGVSRARNHGLSMVQGSWITFLDDDDVISPDKLSRQVEACTETGRPWAISSVCVVDEDLDPIRVDRVKPSIGLARELLASYVLPAVMSNVLVERSTAETIGGLDARFFHNADWDYVTRLSLLSDPAFVAPADVGYVLHSRNVSGMPRGKREDLELFEQKFAEERDRLGAESSITHSLRWIGMSSGRFGQRKAARDAYLEAYRRSGDVGDLARFGLVNMPSYARLMDRRQRRDRLAARKGDLVWLAELRRESWVR